MDKRLSRIEGKSGTSLRMLAILTIMNLINVGDSLSSRQLIIYLGIFFIYITNQILEYYGELIVNENSILNLIPVSREYLLKNYIYNLLKTSAIIAGCIGFIYANRNKDSYMGSFIWISLFVEFTFIIVGVIDFNLVSILEKRLSRDLDLNNNTKILITLIISGLLGGVFYLSKLIALKYPIVLKLHDMKILKKSMMLDFKYEYIRANIFTNIEGNYINIVFIIVLLLISLLIVLLNKYLKRGTRDES